MSERCPIWGTPAEVWPVHGDHDAFRVRSPRAGGDYRITGTAAAIINVGDVAAETKAKLTTALINRRRDGDEAPLVDSNLLGESETAAPLSHETRAMRLLAHIADRESAETGPPVSLGREDLGALAHSESLDRRPAPSADRSSRRRAVAVHRHASSRFDELRTDRPWTQPIACRTGQKREAGIRGDVVHR